MGNGNYVYLGEGDFSIHTMKLCADSEINLPNGSYEGISIYIDLQEITSNPPYYWEQELPALHYMKNYAKMILLSR